MKNIKKIKNKGVIMRTTYKILLLAIVIFYISGCAPQDQGGYLDETNYRTGSQGLVINFLTNAPPSKMYSGDNLEMILEVENRGAYPEETDNFNGKLEVSGVDPNAIDGRWDGGNHIPATLRGRSISNPDGSTDIMSFKDMNGIKVPFGGPKYDANFLVTACYQYKTIAEPMVCVDPEPYKIIEENKVCRFDDGISTGGSQGAPVAVTSVTERVSSDNIIFDIYISNVGGGKVIDWAAYEECPFDLEYSDVNKVRVYAKLPYDGNPDCTPQGSGNDPLILRDGGTGHMVCKFRKPGGESAFKTPLHIELEYTYSTSVSKRVEIINID